MNAAPLRRADGVSASSLLIAPASTGCSPSLRLRPPGSGWRRSWEPIWRRSSCSRSARAPRPAASASPPERRATQPARLRRACGRRARFRRPRRPRSRMRRRRSSRSRRGRSRGSVPRAIAQTKAMIPLSMLGAWKCTAAILSSARREGAHQDGAQKNRPPKGPVKRFAESVAVSSTTPVDFPISALADFLVQPLGAASTYFRAALGALVNLGGRQRSCKRPAHEKLAVCGFFNNQHFHSRPCSLWKRVFVACPCRHVRCLVPDVSARAASRYLVPDVSNGATSRYLVPDVAVREARLQGRESRRALVKVSDSST